MPLLPEIPKKAAPFLTKSLRILFSTSTTKNSMNNSK